jgi:hypothetical protein
VLGEERQHVADKGDRVNDGALAGTVDIQFDLDVGLFGLPGYFCFSGHN